MLSQARIVDRQDERDEQEAEEGLGLMETVSSLRRDVSTLTADLQKVLTENAKLRRRLEEASRERASLDDEEDAFDGLHRVKQEVDELRRLYDRSSGRRRPERTRRSGGRGERSRLRQLMMMLLMTELY